MPTILITGANRGIGLELTRQYAQSGWTVHACCRMPENAHELNTLARDSSGRIQVHLLNVSNEAQRQALAAHLKNTSLDILLNNAGVYGDWAHQGFGQSDSAEWDTVWRTNVLAPMQMMECFVEQVAASELKIIANMSSKMGSMADNGSGGSYLYRSSKAALNAISVSAARDLKARGITVVALHPGWVRTEMGGPNGELSVVESAISLRRNLSELTLDDSGRFIDIDGLDIPF